MFRFSKQLGLLRVQVLSFGTELDKKPAMLEFQLTPSSISTIHIWLTTLLGISFLLTIGFLLHFANVRFLLTPQYLRISKFSLAILASFQSLAWQLYLYSSTHDRVALWCFLLSLFVGFVVWKLLNKSLALNPLVVRTLPVAIFLISLVELAGFAQATKHFSETNLLKDNLASNSYISAPGVLVETAKICGKTDRGTTIKFFIRQISPGAMRDYVEKSRIAFLPQAERAMLRSQPSSMSNCHGWVFAQSTHILRGEDVELILKENNYTEVSKPQFNDVAVYRSNEGAVLHTGVVRGQLDGATLVESKWGIGAVYLHIAEIQPYSQNITYYRTDRPTHSILTQATETIATAGTNYGLIIAFQPNGR